MADRPTGAGRAANHIAVAAQKRIDVLTAERDALAELLDQVVSDWLHHCCDRPDTCWCSIARARRHLAGEPQFPDTHETPEKQR